MKHVPGRQDKPRSKVELDPENPTIILTVRGVGYKAGVPGSSQ